MEVENVRSIAWSPQADIKDLSKAKANNENVHTSGSYATRQNNLLGALPTAEFGRLASHLELIQIPLGKVLYHSGDELRYAYFPTTAIVSLHYVTENGASAEINRVGNEGIIGISIVMGARTMPSQATVQRAGYAYRLNSQVLKDEFNRADGLHAGALHHLLLRYLHTLMIQISQTAVCNRHHSVEQQLCRWLLLNLDRSSSDELTVTQELIASALGVRREGVTEAAGKLQRAGFVSYCRGHLKLLDRSGLEKRVCECYQVVKTELDCLLLDVTATQAVAHNCM